MRNYDSLKKIDDSIVFFDNQDVAYTKINAGNNNLDFKDKQNLKMKINYRSISDNTLNINLFAGVNSSYLQNKIICNDEEIKNKQQNNVNYSFDDSNDYKGRPIEKSIITSIFTKTLGLESHDPLFNKISNEPFSDEENIEDARRFLEMPNEIKYPKYYNAYSLNRLNSSISVFGTLESISGENTTERPLQGIVCEIINNSTDARERNIQLTSSITLRERNSSNQIESYSDEEYQDIILNDDVLLRASFKYTNRIVNGNVITILDTSEGSSSQISVLSNKIIFYTEDNNFITAFDDTVKNDLKNGDYNDDEISYSTGQTIDMSEGQSTDSLGFLGEIN